MQLQGRTVCAAGPRSRCPGRAPLQVVCGLRFFSRLSFQRPTPSGISASQASSRRRPAQAGSLVLDKPSSTMAGGIKYHGVHHVALLVSNLERSLEFYQGVLGLEVNADRPHNKLPYRGAWLWIGPEMIHLMELDNPDPMHRPEHGGRDRHFCVGVTSIQPLVDRLQAANVKFTMSMSGRKALFFRDPDMNTLEVVEQEPWRAPQQALLPVPLVMPNELLCFRPIGMFHEPGSDLGLTDVIGFEKAWKLLLDSEVAS